MNSEISSALTGGRQPGTNLSPAITSDRRMPPQDQRNSRDVGLFPPGSGEPEDSQPVIGRTLAGTGSPGSGPLTA